MNHSKACVIGIDVGTSGVRAIAVDLHANQLAMARYLYSDLGAGNSQDYRSPELWWRSVEKAVEDVVNELSGFDVLAMAVDGTSGSVLPIDKKGSPLAEPLMYNDAIEDKQLLESIASCMPDTSAAGGATSGLAKALSFLNLNPYKIIHQADWIVGQLTGEYTHSDANNALKTGFDPVAMCWPEWISETADVVPLLPDVVTPGETLGTLSAEVAKRFNLSTDVKIIAGTTDGCAAFLATGASETGDAVTSLGSTLTLKLLSDRPIFSPQYGIYSHRIGDMWLAGGASNTGGAVLAHFFSQTEIMELSCLVNSDVPTNLDYYPLVKPGERFPVNDPDMVPRLEPRPELPQVFLQGLLEGIAAVEKLGYEKLVAVGGPQVRSIRSVGGGANSTVFTQIRKTTQTVKFASTLSEEAAFGAAMLAKRAVDRMSLW